MNEKMFVSSPIEGKKAWTKPVVTAIELRSARNSNPAVISDSGSNHRS